MTSGRSAGSIREASRSRACACFMCRLIEETQKRSGTRPSSFMREGRKFLFHCCNTIRVLVSPASARAEPIARTPAGAIRVSAKKNGSIRVRWSNAQAMTVARSWRVASVRSRRRMSVSSPEGSNWSPLARNGSSIACRLVVGASPDNTALRTRRN
ncbi:MAG: hypothetical protein NT031_08485 [Planctomycetota bacterium]|nr:hypothetical protein [Planctomycetota bacterium]